MKKHREKHHGPKGQKPSPARASVQNSPTPAPPVVLPVRVRRKPKPGLTGFERRLTGEQYRTLTTWLRNGVPYSIVIPRIADLWNMRVSSGTISTFYHRWVRLPEAGPAPHPLNSPVVFDILICARMPGQPAASEYRVSFTLPPQRGSKTGKARRP
jgi:hypothetical protein